MISVVIRVKNEMPYLERLVEALKLQTYKDYEIVVVDNESTDGSLEYAKQHADKVVSISQKSFRYYLASNLGIQNSLGNYIYIISAHCLPVSNKLFEIGLEILNQNENVAAVFGRNVFDKSHGNSLEGVLEHLDLTALRRGTKFYRRYTPGIAQSSTCLMRTELMKKYPFPKMFIKGGEDALWALNIIHRGYSIAYDPNLDVFHSHGGSFFKTIKRYFFWSIEGAEAMVRSYLPGNPSGQQ